MFPTTKDGRSYSVTPGNPDEVHYPSKDTYQFNEFAALVVELGGYGDISLIDPYTGSRLWVADVFTSDTDGVFDALRKALDVAEEVGWGKR